MGNIYSNTTSLSALASSLAQAFSQPANATRQGYAYPNTYYATNSPNFSLVRPTLYDQQGYVFTPNPQNNPALQSVNYYPEYIQPNLGQFDFTNKNGINQLFNTNLIQFSQTSGKAVGDYQLPQYQQLHGYDPYQLVIFNNNETAQSFLNTSNKIMSGIFGRPIG